ncbi:MAG: hypothetical protein R2939_11645 [Kofleriaceae bacterium]
MSTGAGALVAAAVVACSDPSTTAITQLNLDRPVDVAFACYGGVRLNGGAPGQVGDEVTTGPLPVETCAIRSRTAEEGNVPPGQEDLTASGGEALTATSYQALILQSVPGTVAIATVPTKPAEEFSRGDVIVGDADELTPGKNGISVGSLPVAIAVDRDGCFAVTANAGSCDLSTLELATAIGVDRDPVVERVTVTSSTGAEILARPAAMVAEPPAGTIGTACGADPTGVVYVAYPGCHLVAAVEPATGAIVAGIQFGADGTPAIVDGDVTCPGECGGAEPATAGPRPVAIELLRDPRTNERRLLVGSENSNALAIVELTEASLPESVAQLALEGDVGVTDLALSPQIGMGGSSGVLLDEGAPGGQFQFVYAVATDGSVRVADVLDLRQECDTQVDPRFLRDETDVSRLACLPVGDVATPPRRASARGPGIQLPGASVPLSVAIVPSDTYAGDDRLIAPTKLVGYFALIGSTSGAVYVANIDDDEYPDAVPPGTSVAVSVPLAIAHQLRDSVPERDLLAETTDDDGNSVFVCDTNGPNAAAETRGGPRADAAPRRLINEAFVASETATVLPQLRQVECDGFDGTFAVSELGFAAPPAVRDEVFPDLMALNNTETWSLTWEGALSLDDDNDDVDGPAIRLGTVRVGGTGMRVVDPAAPYCAAGVEVGDQVVLRGCDPVQGDSDCPLGFSCYSHPDSEVSSGSCLPSDQVDELAGPCRDFLISSRRYSVAGADADELRLVERPRVLRTTPVSGCTSATQCEQLEAVAQRLASTEHPVDDDTELEPHTWACEPEPSRPGSLDRCVMTCASDDDCEVGTLCNDAGRCVEGVVPPLQCVVGLQRYDLRASDAFTVIGSVGGYQHPIIADETTGACVVDPEASPLLIGRLPLTAPPCTGDGLTDLTPNPCSLEVEQFEEATAYQAGTCTSVDGDLVSRTTSAIRFRNAGLTLTMVDPTYPGDEVCIGDRAGDLVDVPTVFPGMTFEFRQVEGLEPLILNFSTSTSNPLRATLPVQIVRGPQDSIWVVDEGDFLSSSINTASTRGKVFRVEGLNLGTINTLQ